MGRNIKSVLGKFLTEVIEDKALDIKWKMKAAETWVELETGSKGRKKREKGMEQAGHGLPPGRLRQLASELDDEPVGAPQSVTN